MPSQAASKKGMGLSLPAGANGTPPALITAAAIKITIRAVIDNPPISAIVPRDM
jgi:hypothetical protein